MTPSPLNSTKGRPLTARQLVASALLGTQPPRLPVGHLIKAGELFGIADGTVRVALSRMTAAGEVTADEGWYQLTGPLLDRQARQLASRHPETRPWSEHWSVHVVDVDRRDASERSTLREAARRLRLAELREGVWMRPDNLASDADPAALEVVNTQCHSFVAVPEDHHLLVERLWDLDAWSGRANQLLRDLERNRVALEQGNRAQLRPSFEAAAAVLRHLLADPLLPDELLPDDWPAELLRRTYDPFEREFQSVWRQAFAE